MLHHSATLIAQVNADTQPPFWWIGLFASPGGLIIVGMGMVFVITLIVVASAARKRRRRR